MTEKRGYPGPLPGIDFRRQVADEVFPPFQASISGEFSASRGGMPLGLARFDGRVKSVHLSAYCGYNSSQEPTIEANVKINGVSVFSTKPKLVGNTGAVAYKTTFEAADDTGATQAVLNAAAIDFVAGDLFTWDLAYTGNGSPSVKTANPAIIVEVEPY